MAAGGDPIGAPQGTRDVVGAGPVVVVVGGAGGGGGAVVQQGEVCCREKKRKKNELTTCARAVCVAFIPRLPTTRGRPSVARFTKEKMGKCCEFCDVARGSASRDSPRGKDGLKRRFVIFAFIPRLFRVYFACYFGFFFVFFVLFLFGFIGG